MTPYFAVVVDNDKQHFTLCGPLTDDVRLMERVAAAKADGRDIALWNGGTGHTDFAATTALAEQYFPGFKEIPWKLFLF